MSRGRPAETAGLATVRQIADLRRVLSDWRKDGQSIGLVPTMGALHAGHMALISEARQDCRRVIASLFVNPAQFNDPKDLAAYPRDEAADAARFAAAGIDLLYAPPAEEVYPSGFATKVSVPALSAELCGAARPGHMDGVATVVTKLLTQAQPDRAYFGEKDYQQLLIVRRLAADLDLGCEIAAVPTVREADGLALSSRNQLLSDAVRPTAALLYRTLQDTAERLADGAAAAPLCAAAAARLLDAGFSAVDYLELRAEADLALLPQAAGPCRLFAAAWLDGVRLIDNVAIG